MILIGLIFGYGVKGTPSKSLFLSRAFGSGKLIVTLFVLIVYYSYVLAPDWMWMYFVADATMPRWMVFYALILYYFAYTSGFALSVEGRRFSGLYPPLLMLVMLGAEIALIWALQDRYQVVGTFEQFQAGTGIPLAESTVGGLPMILSGLLIPLGLGLLLWSRKQKFS